MIYTLIPLFSYVYFIVLQTYVLKIELILNGVGIVLLLIEIFFSLIAIATISTHEKII